MKKLNPILRWDNLDLLGIALFLSIVSFFVGYLSFILVLFLFYARKHLPWMLYFFSCILCFILWIMVAEEPKLSSGTYMGVVIDIDNYDRNDRYIIRIDHKNYHLYLPSGSLEIGDKTIINGQIQRYENATVPDGFDRYMYYRSKNIMGKIYLDSYEKVGDSIGFYGLRHRVYTFYRELNVSPYALNLLFGKDLDESMTSIYEQLGITYLLSISGLHLYVIVMVIKKILFYFSVSDRHQSMIIFICYAILCYFHRFDIGILRLFILHGFIMLNDYFSWRKSRFELLQMTYILMVLTQVTRLFHVGILISYLMLTVIYLTKPWFDSWDGYMKRILFSGFLMIWLLPFFQRFDLVLCILMPLLIVFIVYGMTLGALFACIAPPFSVFLNEYGLWIEKALLWLNEHRLTIYLPKFEPLWVILYYTILLSLFLVKSTLKKGWITLAYVILMMLIYSLEKQGSRLLFLDVGQGDSTIVETRDCIAVIDSFSEAHDYLKHRGITSIDYLFLTHSDIDHIKEAEMIVRDFHVKHFIGSMEVQSYPDYGISMKKAFAHDKYSCGNITFNILGPIKSYDDENNASLVIQFDFFQTRILLTGDIESEAELDLVHHYGDQLQSDVLKISHHGSSTSSSLIFLNTVNPHKVIISAGRNNRYQFPHEEVISRLENFNFFIYRTDQLGTIIFEPNRKGEKWYFYLPFSPRFWYNMYRVRGRMYG